MAVREILLLGDPRLYEPSTPVERGDVPALGSVIEDLFDTMADFQARHGWGRAIAAPQIGVHRRVVCMLEDRGRVFINPVLHDHSETQIEHWEDCMSFPELLVRLKNPERCRMTYRDEQFASHTVELSEDYAELLAHEVDHLDGVLATDRAIDRRSVVLRRARPQKDATLRGYFRPAPAPRG